jgi:tetratricopeptide (TPR) repeat protein
MANEKLIVELTAQIQGLKSGLDSASAQLTKFNDKTTNTGKNAEKDFDAIGSAASKVGGIVAGAFAIGSVVSFGQGIIAATSEFQKFEAVLSNTLGSSSAAQLALSQIQQFAATTPFQINELTGAFVKLANQGFKPNITQMRLLGDLASSTGKSFDQLAEAILDAQTGEFERLKEFGVRAAVAGDQVTFTFKGIKTQVDNTSEAIRGYVLSLGAAEGVSGSMEKISGTLGGRISNVKDSFTQLQTTIGSINSGVLFAFVGYLQQALSYFNEIINLDLKRVQFAMEGLNMTEQRAVIKEYNAQLSKIGSTDNINKLNEQLKFIQTNLEFYQQAMLNETDEHNRDIAFSYFNAYKDLRNNANTQMAGLQKDLAAKNAALAAEAKKTKRVIGETIDFVAPAIGIKPIPNAPADLGGLKESNFPKLLQDYDKEQKAIKAVNAYLERQNEILSASTMLMGTLTSGFESFINVAMEGGFDAFQGILDALKRLMVKLAAAIVAAAILFVLTGGLSSGGSSLGSIGNIAKTIGGLGFNPFTIFGGGDSRLAMPSTSRGQGGYQVDIMGDKMRLLLDNQAIKNSRVI